MLKFVSFFLLFGNVFGDIFEFTDWVDPVSLFWAQKLNEQLKSNRCVEPTTNGDVVGECIHSTKCILYGGSLGGTCGNNNNNRCCTFPLSTNVCTVTQNQEDFTGTCMSGLKCFKTGGTAMGNCGFLHKCCIYDQSCNRISSAKTSYFEGKMTKSSEDLDCSYTVVLNNPNVCQVRLDFEVLRLSQAVFDTPSKNFLCSVDTLTVSPNNYGIPTICGPNDNGHVYIHLEPKDEQIKLNIKLTKRTEDDANELPHWKIKVTQLQCAGSNDKHKDTSQYDFPLLAPRGAIQYYTEPTGYIRSFGYPNSYIPNEFYDIAFKKEPKHCGARFTVEQANFKTVTTDTTTTCQDYLSVPELNTTVTDSVEQYCSNTVPATFISAPPGPLNLVFRSGSGGYSKNQAYNFRIKYEMLNTNCIA